MDRRSRTPESPSRRHRSRREYSSNRRRSSRSWSRSRSREKSRDRRRRQYSRSRSRSRERNYRRNNSPDLYKDLIDQDYQNDRERYHRNDRRSRDRDRDRSYYRGKDRHYRREQSLDLYLDEINSNDSDQVNSDHYRNQTPSNKIIILGLAQHITEADINNDLIHYGLQPVSIRLIRKRKTGASRGFAFVEFNTEVEAIRWMEFKQGVLMVQDQYRAVMQYSNVKEPLNKEKIATDWYCAKCGVYNFKRRENCFKCCASREESEKGGEGSDEVSNILTKKIMLRNLDVLTNEEGVLTTMQEVVPTLVSKISKILICRDPLTSTSRGICYLSFDNLIDSMNTHNALKACEPPIKIDNREVLISYCVDSENKQISKPALKNHAQLSSDLSGGSCSGGGGSSGGGSGGGYTTPVNTHQYTLADVPRLAEYSAGMYASTPAEYEHYHKYYTDFYIGQISKGQFGNLPTMSQIGETANSGAAVALSAIQRKQKQYKATTAAVVQPQPVQVPTGTDNKTYATPDISLYQYDETSGYYYDPMTGLYYDPHSQYYYNNESGAYLYWCAENRTYLLAANRAQALKSDTKTETTNTAMSTTQPSITVTTAAATTNSNHSTATEEENNTTSTEATTIDLFDSLTEEKKDPNSKRENKHDKVKVAKKIVKDMEKWAKQLNQKKELNMMQPMVTSVSLKDDEIIINRNSRSGYADVGFSILENKERVKMIIESTATNPIMATQQHMNKLVSSYGSDSDNEQNDNSINNDNGGPGGGSGSGVANEKDYVDFDKLTCLLCKRAFQSSDILNKHLKMSNLHKENLQKYNLSQNNGNDATNSTSYRDRAKERRLKYGECDPPPPNRSRERFEKEIEKHTAAMQVQKSSRMASVPIGENNVGNRLLQKMGWTEGQGLGRSNQGRTNIIEAESRASTAGLGTKSTNFGPGDDYKSYIKRMMKSRYEQVD